MSTTTTETPPDETTETAPETTETAPETTETAPETTDEPIPPCECTPGPPPPEDIAKCQAVLDQTNEIINTSTKDAADEAENVAIRAFAKLCLHEAAEVDLKFASDHEDELTNKTRELLEAVNAANKPEGEELIDVVKQVGP